jgi:hypothetical protein
VIIVIVVVIQFVTHAYYLTIHGLSVVWGRETNHALMEVVNLDFENVNLCLRLWATMSNKGQANYRPVPYEDLCAMFHRLLDLDTRW